MDLKNRGGKAPAKSLIYMAENTGGEGGKAPAKSLKTRRRKAEKKSPLIVPPLRRAPGLLPGRAAGACNLSVKQLIEQIAQICAQRRVHSFRANLDRQEMRLRSELRSLGLSERSTDTQVAARERVARALDALGGHGSPAGSCAWYVIGMQTSLREWAVRQGWGGRPVRQESAQGILVAALGVLMKHFGIRDRGGRRCA